MVTSDPQPPDSGFSFGGRIVVACLALMLLSVVAVGCLVWLPYHNEQQIIEHIRDLSGKVRLETFDTFGMQQFLTADQPKLFDRVTEVWCADSEITDAGVKQISGLKKLKRLGLSQTPISDGGLANLRRVSGLESLYVDGTDISDSGLTYLAGLTNLKRLSLTDTAVSEIGLDHLNGLKDLEFLWLKHTRVSDVGLAKLKATRPDCQISR